MFDCGMHMGYNDEVLLVMVDGGDVGCGGVLVGCSSPC
jgi:hypothetical protein